MPSATPQAGVPLFQDDVITLCNEVWPRLRELWLSCKISEIDPEEDAQRFRGALECNTRLLNYYYWLLTRRLGSFDPNDCEIATLKDDDRRLVAQYCYHADLARLAALPMDTIRSKEDMAKRIRDVQLLTTSADLLAAIGGPNFVESLFELLNVVRRLAGDPEQFLENLDVLGDEVETRTLSYWDYGYSAEKTILVCLLRYWWGTLGQVARIDGQADLDVVSLHDSLALSPRWNVELKLAVGLQGMIAGGGTQRIVIESDRDLWEPQDRQADYLGERSWRTRSYLESRASGVGRVRLRVRKRGGDTEGPQDSSVRLELAGRRGGCVVRIGSTARRPNSSLSVDEWYKCEKDAILSAKEGSRVVIASWAGRIGDRDLSPQGLKDDIENTSVSPGISPPVSVIIEEIVGLGLPMLPAGDQLLLIAAGDSVQSEAIWRRFRLERPELHLWDASIGGYLRRRLEGFDFETAAEELLLEYLKPLRAEDQVKAFLGQVALKTRYAQGPQQVQSRTIEDARKDTPLIKDEIGKMIRGLQGVDSVALEAVYTSLRKNSNDDGEWESSFVGLAEIGRTASGQAFAVGGLSEALDKLATELGILDREGKICYRYRFANRLYAHVAKEVVGKKTAGDTEGKG